MRGTDLISGIFIGHYHSTRGEKKLILLYNADLRIGDQILKANGKDVSAVSLDDYCGILQNGLNDARMDELGFVVLQDGQERHLRLEKTDLLGYSVAENA